MKAYSPTHLPHPARAVYIAFNRSTGFGASAQAWVTATAQVICMGNQLVPTHVRVGFRFADGSLWYYEAMGLWGWRGPIPEKKATEWVQKRRGRWTRVFFLDLDESAAAAAHFHAESHLPGGCGETWKYGHAQLPAIYLWRLLGLRPRSSEASVICSEAPVRVLKPWIDLTPKGETIDSVNPWNLYNHVLRMVSPAGITAGLPFCAG